MTNAAESCDPERAQLPPELYGETASGGGGQPPDAVLLPTETGHALLAVNLREPRYRVAVPSRCLRGIEPTFAKVLLCVDAAGAVTHTTLVKPSLPVVDRTLPGVLAHWRFRPYLVDGRPTPYCYEEYFGVTPLAR